MDATTVNTGYTVCPNCGHKNHEGNQFCEKCGSSLQDLHKVEKLLDTDPELIALNEKYAKQGMKRFISGFVCAASVAVFFMWLEFNLLDFFFNLVFFAFPISLALFLRFSFTRSRTKKKILRLLEEKNIPTTEVDSVLSYHAPAESGTGENPTTNTFDTPDERNDLGTDSADPQMMTIAGRITGERKYLRSVGVDDSDTPHYILAANEGVLMPVGKSKLPGWLKKTVWIIVGLIVGFSLLFQENLFVYLSFPAQILLVGLLVWVMIDRVTEDYCPSPIELQFYEDYMVVYRKKRYRGNISRLEICKLKYSEITKVTFRTNYHRIHIYGSGTTSWYNYRKDGTLPDNPTKVNSYTGGLVYFNTSCAPGVDFIQEIEEHSPLKVILENV